MKVCILKYNGGNTQSVIFALNRLGVEPVLSNDPQEILTADKVIFPGVGEAKACMNSLQATGLDKVIPALTMPVLGICVGLQLMCVHTEESDTQGLGIFRVKVKKFSGNNLKVPHMGWNSICELKSHLFNGVEQGSHVYYVHSYAAELGAETIAKTNYGADFSAALHTRNFYAVQFHAEKSSHAGAKILDNFLRL